MKNKPAFIGTVIGVLALFAAEGWAASTPTPSAPSRTEDGLTELAGNVPTGISRNSATVLNSHVAIYVERLAKSGRAIPEQTTRLMTAGKAALDAKDYGRAYRLAVRALGWAHGADQVEAYDVAGSFAPALNRALFASGENITLTLRPQFTLGHALANRYATESWLETPAGPIAGTTQKLTVDDLREYHFDHPVQSLPDGIIAVCYRLRSPAGETLAELKHAVVVAKDAQARLEKMKAAVAAVSQPVASGRTPAFATAVDTANYAIRSLEQERAKFDDGSFGRSGSALGKYLIQLNWTAAKIPVASFPPFDARLRYPQDVDLAESLVTALAADSDALLKRSGDMALACASSKNDELLRYRIFVPEGYDPARKYSLIVALHSGAGDGEFFEFENIVARTPDRPRENAFKRLAQERGCILVCPKGGQAGFFGERGETNVLDVAERVQKTFSLDAKQVFLTGWSGRSEAAWRIALKHPDRFAAAAPVGVTPGIAKLLTPQATERARELPILYSVPGTEAEQGRMLNASAKPLLRRFTYTEYPDAEHADVWLQAQPALFDFFAAAAAALPAKNDPPATGAYFGQRPPGARPEIFAPGILSLTDRQEDRITFSPDGKECFFTVWGPKYSSAKIYWTKCVDEAWTPQVEAPFSANNFASNPSFSVDGNRVYFHRANYRGPEPYDLWMVERTSRGWSEPRHLPSPINSDARDGGYTETADGVAYFCSNRPGGLDDKGDIWRTRKIPGQPLQVENLGATVNSSAWDSAPVIAPDGSYLVFTSERPGKVGSSDLYATFADGKGGWTAPANMNEYCPGINGAGPHCANGGLSLSADGRYLFFTRLTAPATGVQQDIYWVENPFLDPARRRPPPKGPDLGRQPPGQNGEPRSPEKSLK
jgi:hypothetical protein